MVETLRVAGDVLLVVGIVAMGVGFFWRKRRAHHARAAGWFAFGLFWFVQMPGYVLAEDVLNALGAAAALPVFAFIAYHEKMSYDWNEEYEPLRFAAGAAFFASAVYFSIDRVPILTGYLVAVVADHTAGLMNLVAAPYTSGAIDYAGNPLWWRANGNDIMVPMINSGGTTVVNIVLACTALQGYAVAASLMLSTRDPWRSKALALGIVLPVTYVMNLVRNLVVIYFFAERGDPFEIVHNWYGKTLSLAVLIILVLVAFRLLPELYVNINGLFELPWRKKPGHDYRKYVGRLTHRKESPP